MKTRRIQYLIATILLLLVEVFIALFVHDNFVRPYIGDVLVVIVIYTFVRIFVPEKYPLLPVGIFIFAAAVEFLQLLNITEVLGLGENVFLRILLGSVFDITDIACYLAGTIIILIIQTKLLNIKK